MMSDAVKAALNEAHGGVGASVGPRVALGNIAEFAKKIAPIPPAKDTWVKGTVYGDSGMGKTRMALTKRNGGKVLFANIEDGYLSIAGSGIDKVDLKAYRDFQNLFLYLKLGKHPYDTVWIDSFTEAQKFAVSEIADEKVSAGKDKDPFKLSLEDYGLATERLRRWLWDMRSLPMHVFYVCLSKPVIAKGEIVTKQTLAVTQKLAEGLFAYSDLVAFLTTADVQVPGSDDLKTIRRLHLRATPEMVAKARMPVEIERQLPGGQVPPYMNVPSLDKIIALYRGETKKKEEGAA